MTQVRLVSPDPESPLVLDLNEFFLANEFEPEEVAEIRATLAMNETYLGGGGAAPEWSIEPVL